MSIIVILVIIVIFIALFLLYYMQKEAFKQTVLNERRDKHVAIKTLKEMNMYDENIFEYKDIRETTIKSKEGYKLKGYFIEKYQGSNKYVILIHGFKWNHYFPMAFAKMFINEGFNVLIIDQRNHGKSEGPYPTYGYYEKDDISLWIDEIKKRYPKDDILIGLHGQSMGAATALIVGGNNKNVKFVVADCGFSRAKDCVIYTISKHKGVPVKLVYRLLKAKLLKLAKFNVEKSNPIDEIIKRRDLPVLFVHGTSDTRIPTDMSIKMYNKKHGKYDILFLVKDAIHMNAYGVSRKEYEYNVHKIIEAAKKEQYL